MRLTDVKLSTPYVFYDVAVSHFTSRKATAIEWVILEAIRTASTSKDYKDAPFSAVFEEIFSVKEADRLLKPVIYDLVGFGMISVEGLSDEESLSRMSMSQFSLTDKGEKLRREGVLPGKTMEDVVQVVFNASSGTLCTASRKGLSEEPTGLKKSDIDTPDDLVFPASEVMDYLDQARSKGTISWLGKDAQVQDIVVQSSELLWKNSSAHLEVGRNLECALSGSDDQDLNALALGSIPLEHDIAEVDSSISNPDEEPQWLDDPSNALPRVLDALPKNGFAVVSKRAFDAIGERKIAESIGSGAVLITGSETATTILGKTVLVHTSNNVLPTGGMLSTAQRTISIGNFDLTAGACKRQATLLYATEGMDVETAFEDAARETVSSEILAALPLLAFGSEGLFLGVVEDAIGAIEKTGDKVAALSKLNEAAVRLGLDALPVDTVRSLLLEGLAGSISGLEVEDIPDAISREIGDSSMEGDEDLGTEVIRIAVGTASPPSAISQVWAFWQSLERRGWASGQVGESPEIRNIYTDECVRQMLMVFTADELYTMPAYTIVERSILQLRRASDSIRELLPGADLTKPLTVEDARRTCLANKSSLGDVYSELKAWRSKINDLESVGIDENSLMHDDLRYSRIATSLQNLALGIEPFYDEGMLKYDNVYVVDTCAIMNEPGLVSEFESDWAMLVITHTTLEELDFLKSSEDEEKAFNARDAIREIDNHRAFGWLNLRESSYPELLSGDSDAGRNDNKILSVALRYIIKAPVLITDDANLRNIAEAYSIDSVTSAGFLQDCHQKKAAARKAVKGKNKKR